MSDESMTSRACTPRRTALTLGLFCALSALGCASPEAESATSALRSESAGSLFTDFDCDHVYELRVSGPKPDAPYIVAAGAEVYPQFLRDAPWGEKRVTIAGIGAITDNAKVLKGWTLYAGKDALASWKAGDDEVENKTGGRVLPTSPERLRLDLHYDNRKGSANESDRSGFTICAMDAKDDDSDSDHDRDPDHDRGPGHDRGRGHDRGPKHGPGPGHDRGPGHAGEHDHKGD